MNLIWHVASRVRSSVVLAIAILGILIATLASPISAPISAHEGRGVGEYNFVVGFLREPAYEGHLNAVSLVVTRIASEEDSSGAEADQHSEHTTMAGMSSMESDDASQPDGRASDVDVLTHGAIFISPGIAMMEEFEFEISEELVGVEIPYHVHPGDQQGTIAVSAENQSGGEDQSIMIMDGQLMPAKLDANVGDTVVWMNHEKQNAVIMSGPLSSMTSEMTTMMEPETPSITAVTTPAQGRVTGLASSLQVEVAHLPTAASRVMPLTEVYNDPGHYIAEFVPTAPGDYQLRFFGSIEGNAIDETFNSGPDTFDTVVASDAIQFPIVLESNREIQNATQGALDAIQEAETDIDAVSSTASTGLIIGIIGIGFGLVATGASIFAITIARRRN